jgi:hypothetical protein
VTGWRPKGFERFFTEFGIPAEREHARELSVSEDIVRRVVAGCERLGMYLSA